MTYFLGVTHISKYGTQVRVPSVNHFSSVTYFGNCDPFFQVWYTFLRVTHSYKFDLVFKVWSTFTSVTHFSKFDLLLQVWFPLHECDPPFQVWPILLSDPFFQVRHTFPIVTNFSKCNLLFLVWPTFSSVKDIFKCDQFSKLDPFPSLTHFQVWHPFPSEPHFLKCDPLSYVWLFFQAWSIFSSLTNVTHFSKCNLFVQVSHILK